MMVPRGYDEFCITVDRHGLVCWRRPWALGRLVLSDRGVRRTRPGEAQNILGFRAIPSQVTPP
jgi:hypothetical protein